MKLKFLISLAFVFLLFSCKAKYNHKKEVLFKLYVQDLRNEGFINDNPLIVVNYKPIEDIKYSSVIPERVNQESLSYIKEDYNFFVELWGEKARNGILFYDDRITLWCKSPKEVIYLLNKQEVEFDVYINELSSKTSKTIRFWKEMSIPIENGEFIHVSVLETSTSKKNK